MKFLLPYILLFSFILGKCFDSFSQISPGDLAKVHAHLEGMSNCTKCHTMGSKISNDKCLACHTYIRDRINRQRGYHASSEVKGKACALCHNDHHGKNFQIIRFNTVSFQHILTGFRLEGAHAKQQCINCHNSKLITDKKIQYREGTYLGLGNECNSCHSDYHQGTLGSSCSKCHGQEAFKPAVNFNHANTKFPLVGKHQTVECSKCHSTETIAGKSFQKFAGIGHSNCTNCHSDIHQNKFGQNCAQCHSETSFHLIKNNKSFDHDRTGFRLEGLHANVTCLSCHKRSYTDPLRYDNCNDCHNDYHKGQFAVSGKSPDCKKCHTVNGFRPSLFTIDDHNKSNFKLTGSHLATACSDCHKKQNRWNFAISGINCVDCHVDIHKSSISQNYYPNQNCRVCHSESSWSDVHFNHSSTHFQLTGEHLNVKCRECHFINSKNGPDQQKFAGLQGNCNNCHTDNHHGQFDKNGVTNCNRCHDSDNWKAGKFNHNTTAFKLDGKHENLACAKCHKLTANEKYVQYKIKNFRCEDCHLQ